MHRFSLELRLSKLKTANWEKSNFWTAKTRYRTLYSFGWHRKKKKKIIIWSKNDATIENHPCIVHCTTVIWFSFAHQQASDRQKERDGRSTTHHFYWMYRRRLSAHVVVVVVHGPVSVWWMRQISKNDYCASCRVITWPKFVRLCVRVCEHECLLQHNIGSGSYTAIHSIITFRFVVSSFLLLFPMSFFLRGIHFKHCHIWSWNVWSFVAHTHMHNTTMWRRW